MSQLPEDPYARLRPRTTPPDEVCACTGESPLLLRSSLTKNPVACFACNLEVPPERIGFPRELADALAHWTAFHDCFYRLWLDAGEFEDWARAQLEAVDSAVHRRGLGLAAELGRFRACYYGWFAGADDEARARETCVLCGGLLHRVEQGRACETCRILYG